MRPGLLCHFLLFLIRGRSGSYLGRLARQSALSNGNIAAKIEAGKQMSGPSCMVLLNDLTGPEKGEARQSRARN